MQLGELTSNTSNSITGSIAPDSNGKMFNGETLTKLYDAILGPAYTNTGTYGKIKKALTNSDGTTTQSWAGFTNTAAVPNAITAADIRTNNGGNVFVTIAGVDFEVVYVTLNNSDEVIVDLWQAASTVTSRFSATASGGQGYSEFYSKNDTSHPCNVYGLSYLRAVTLGQGGAWDAFGGTPAANPTAQSATVGSATGAYAVLWNDMTSVSGYLSKFIDTPAQVKYQEVESVPYQNNMTGITTVTGMGKNDWWKFSLPGDAYGTPVSENYYNFIRRSGDWNVGGTSSDSCPVNTGYGGNGTNQITNQDQWMNDKLWLPSLAETGHFGVYNSTGTNTTLGGIWGLDNDQRNNNGGSYPSSFNSNVNSANVTWLRSGAARGENTALYLTSSGAMNSAYTSSSLAVRPALHLNLNKVQKSATSGSGLDTQAADVQAVNTPRDIEFTYDGIAYTDMGKIIERVEAGKQKSTPDANGDFNTKGEITWFDEILHAGGGSTAGNAPNTIYKAGSAIEYKIEYKQVGKNTYETAMTDFKICGAGEYKITCSFEPDSKYKWRDSVTGALDTDATKEFKITVKQLEVKYKWKSSGGKLNETDTDASKQWKVKFDKDNFMPTNGNSQAPWVYLDYTLLTTTSSTDNANAALLTYDQTNNKAMLGANVNDTLPCVVVKYVNTEQYDNPIDNIYVNKNGTTAPTNSTGRAYPQEAGHYTVTATDINKDTSNYKLVPDTNEPALSSTRGYEIEKQEVQVPLKPNNPLEYSGSEQQYNVADFKADYMEYGTLSGTTFTKDAMPVDSNGNPLGMTADTSAGLVLKATAVNDYKISFRLLQSTPENTTAHPDPLVRNYKWKSTDNTINGTDSVVTVNYAILQKTLELDFHSSVKNASGNETFTIKTNDTTGKLTYTFKTNCGPVTPNGATGPEEPVLELYFAEAPLNGAGSINPKNATKPEEFLYGDLVDSSNKHKAGKYVIFVRLADSSANPVNKNYRLKDIDAITAEMTDAGASQSDIEAAVTAAKATYLKEITLTAGEVNLNDLPIVYKEGNNITNSDAPTQLSFDYANNGNLQYKLGTDGKTPVQYWIYFDLSDEFSFMEVVGAISYQYDSPATNTDPCNYDPYAAMNGNTTGSFPVRYAGKLTITVKVKVKDSEKANNKLPGQQDYDDLATPTAPNKFTYTAGTPDENGNVYDGTLVFTYQIRKAEIDSTKIAETSLLQWKYSTDDDTKWRDYTATSFPEYSEIAQVDFRVNPSKYTANGDGTLAGVTAASLDSITNAAGQPEKQGPGQRFVTIAYTVDENNFEKVNHNNTTLSGKYKYTVEISPKVIDSSKLTLTTWKDSSGNDKTNSLGVPYQIWELDLDDPTFKNFIEYEYYLYDGTQNTVGTLIGKGDMALLDLTNPSGTYGYLNIDSGLSAYIYVKPVINLAAVEKVNGEPKYTLRDMSGNTDKDIDGNDGYKKYEFGKQMTVIKVELVKGDSVYKDSFTAADIIKITMGGSVAAGSTYNTKVYKDKIDEENLVGDLAAFCTNSASLGAGKYVIKVTAVNGDLFVAVPATVNFEITPKPVELPTLGEIVFNGSGQSLADFLGGSWNPALMTLGGDFEDIRDVSSNGYSATITLTDSNYCWAYPEAAQSPAVKVLTKYSAADTEITPVSASVAAYKWNVTPLTVDTSKLWNKGNKGATLNLPQNVRSLIDAETLSVGYRYFDGSSGEELPEPSLKGGRSFKVEAVLGGYDAEHGNVLFINKAADGSTQLSTISPQISYTVPQSGAGAFFGKALSFVKSHWLWFLIALAILIFLIVLIIIIAHRRKTKEAREEKKRLKEEEKERKEEERRRKEEEREAARAKQQAELELQKAKQEAELAKMRAGLGLGAGAAGMAMAAQQQPVQQQMPQQPMQPQYQPQPMMQPQMMQMPQYPQYMQMPMPMPQQMPMQYPMPQMQSADSATLLMTKLEAEFAKQAGQRATQELSETKMQTEFDKLRTELRALPAPQPQPQAVEAVKPKLPDGQNADMDMIGALAVSIWKNMKNGGTEKPTETLQEQSGNVTVNTPTVYPPDAVITTTTTVDTTKTKPEPVAPRSDDGRVFDLDGFYDTFDSNK